MSLTEARASLNDCFDIRPAACHKNPMRGLQGLSIVGEFVHSELSHFAFGSQSREVGAKRLKRSLSFAMAMGWERAYKAGWGVTEKQQRETVSDLPAGTL